MASLCTFIGLMVAGGIWMAIWTALGDASTPTLITLADQLSPLAVGGWCLYGVLTAASAWLTYRLLRHRLGAARPVTYNPRERQARRRHKKSQRGVQRVGGPDSISPRSDMRATDAPISVLNTIQKRHREREG